MDANIQFSDPGLDLYQVHNYELSLQVSAKNLSFCVFDTRSGKYLAFKNQSLGATVTQTSFTEKFKKWLTTEELLLHPYKNIRFLWLSPKSTLIPASLFDPSAIETYYNFNFEPEKGQKILSSRLNNAGSLCLYSIPEEVHQMAENILASPKFFHQSVPFIENILLKTKNKTLPTEMHIGVYEDFFDVLVIEKNQILLYNSFTYTGKSDFIYFLLSIFELLKLNHQEVPVIFSGAIHKKSENYELARKYIRQIRMEAYGQELKYNFPLAETEASKYTHLFNLSQCE